MNSEQIKQIAKQFGADRVGVADAAVLNAFPPDPLWPQTPERILRSCRSVIVVVQRIPAGAFRARHNALVQYMDMLVLRKMDMVAYALVETLEQAGHPSLVLAAQETDWSMKKASYGRLSTRHLGVEAGLGTLGLEVNILTPEFGPRVYLTGILTELALEPDPIMQEQVCIGESCSRCLHACPGDAVGHFDIDKRDCAEHAQEFGFHHALKMFRRLAGQRGRDRRREFAREMVVSRDFMGFWQGLLRVVGSFGDCPRCLEVCPVGNDYHAHLVDRHKLIPERTPAKARKAEEFEAARRRGDDIAGLNAWNRRWTGPEGYQGIVARQLQSFKRAQEHRRDAGGDEAD